MRRPLTQRAGCLLLPLFVACGPGATPKKPDPVQPGSERASEVEAAAPEVPALPSPPPRPFLDPDIRAAREAAQRSILGARAQLLPEPKAVEARGEEDPPGVFAPLVHPPGVNGLARFETALAELESGERDTPVRIAVYGASGVAADLWTGYLRHYLQRRFGTGGPGLVWAGKPKSWSRHQEFEFEPSKGGWTKLNSYTLEEGDPGHLGAMGQAFTSEDREAWVRLSPGRAARGPERIRRFEVHHLVQPGGGHYRVMIDGKKLAKVSTASVPLTAEASPAAADGTKASPPPSAAAGAEATDAPEAAPFGAGAGAVSWGRTVFPVEPGRHELEVHTRGDGPVRLLGVVAETEDPGIVVDTMGVGGGRVAHLRAWDEPLWRDHLRARSPELYVLMYGNNESVDAEQPIEVFEADLRFMLDRFARTLPEASCVVWTTGDFPIVGDDGVPKPRPRLAEIHDTQARLAAEYGCALFDFRAMLGGVGAKQAWIDAELAKDDYLHLTRPGYVRVGVAFADALMQGYDWRKSLDQPEP